MERRSSERRKKSTLRAEESYKACEFCGRKFCDNAFDRHVEWCRWVLDEKIRKPRLQHVQLAVEHVELVELVVELVAVEHVELVVEQVELTVEQVELAGRKAVDSRRPQQRTSRLWRS